MRRLFPLTLQKHLIMINWNDVLNFADKGNQFLCRGVDDVRTYFIKEYEKQLLSRSDAEIKFLKKRRAIMRRKVKRNDEAA